MTRKLTLNKETVRILNSVDSTQTIVAGEASEPDIITIIHTILTIAICVPWTEGGCSQGCIPYSQASTCSNNKYC